MLCQTPCIQISGLLNRERDHKQKFLPEFFVHQEKDDIMINTYIQPAFALDDTHIRILEEVAEKPGCKISHVVLRLLSEYGENSVRSKVHQLVVHRYVNAGKSSQEILLTITGKGRISLQGKVPG
jgi:hypothetical protein